MALHMAKAFIPEGQGERAGLTVVDAICETAARGEDARELDEFRREIDCTDAAAAYRGQIAGRTAEAATEIEDLHAGANAGARRMLLGRQDTAAMKLVERMQVTKSGLLRIDTDLHERGLDPLQEVRTAVIALNQRFHISHAPSPWLGCDQLKPYGRTPWPPAIEIETAAGILRKGPLGKALAVLTGSTRAARNLTLRLGFDDGPQTPGELDQLVSHIRGLVDFENENEIALLLGAAWQGVETPFQEIAGGITPV